MDRALEYANSPIERALKPWTLFGAHSKCPKCCPFLLLNNWTLSRAAIEGQWLDDNTGGNEGYADKSEIIVYTFTVRKPPFYEVAMEQRVKLLCTANTEHRQAEDRFV